jgi:hypothetical protein
VVSVVEVGESDRTTYTLDDVVAELVAIRVLLEEHLGVDEAAIAQEVKRVVQQTMEGESNDVE